MNHQNRLTRRIVAAVAVGFTSVAMAAVPGTASAQTTTSGARAALTGQPIVLGNIATVPYTRRVTGVQAAIQAINASGGVNGRPLKLESCTPVAGDPNGIVNCVRKNVAAGAVVELGDIGGTADSVSFLDSKGIPSVGYGTLPVQCNDPLGFYWTYVCSSGPAKGAILGALGKKKVAQATSSIPDYAVDTSIKQAVTASSGGKAQYIGSTVLPTSGDIVPLLTKMLSDQPDGVIVTYGDAGLVIRTLNQVGYTNYVSSACNVISATDAAAIANANPNVYCTTQYLNPTLVGVKNKMLAKFTTEMNAVDRSVVQDDQSVETWLETYWVAGLMKQMTDPTNSAALVDLMSKQCNVTTGGITGPMNFCLGTKLKPFTRVFQTYAYAVHVTPQGKKLVLATPFDITKPSKAILKKTQASQTTQAK